MIHRRLSRKVQKAGIPASCIGRRGWRNEAQGQPGTSIPAPLKDERDEATPILRRRHSLRTQESGQPGIWLGRLKGTMMV
jgi:hypothetical protein